MPGRYWGKLTLVVLVCCFKSAVAGGSDGPTATRVTVAIHNYAGVPAGELERAERTAGLIFKEAELNVEWLTCGPSTTASLGKPACTVTQFPTHLHLAITRRSRNLREWTLGVSYLGEDGRGCYSDVFIEPTEAIHAGFDIEMGTLLGHVMAHEIGHLLLGTNSHSETGIMRAHWTSQDLENASKRALLFTQAQAKTMREKVSEAIYTTLTPFAATRARAEDMVNSSAVRPGP